MDPQLFAVSAILVVTVILIVLEVVRIDLVALMAMLALVFTGAITPSEARSGFASNAVLAVLAVMIMGRGLHQTGVTDRIGDLVLRVATKSRRSIIATLSVTVGTISGVIQNIGAAALFLPVTTSISKRENIPIASLMMPMGFAALLGGTLTMVGTSSLIVLNDLLEYADLEPFGLFAVTPVGVAVLTAGLLYFIILGPYVLPTPAPRDDDGDPFDEDTPPYGRNIQQLFQHYDRELLDLNRRHLPDEDDDKGYLEIVIPARSSLVGRTLREAELREKHSVRVMAYMSESRFIEDGLVDRVIRAGDTIVLYGRWDNLQFFADSEDYVLVNPIRERAEPKATEGAARALVCFGAAIALVVALDFPISIGFLAGAVAMIVTNVMTVEEAYRAVEWKVVFLLAGLIPIGLAMENSGVAAMLAAGFVEVGAEMHPYLILLAIGALMTAFSLTMSNVAATVLMVPLVLQLGDIGGLDPRILVLQVGLCAANSFIIPTHHVNALLMTPGGYRVRDYVVAGTGLSVIFLLVSTTVLYFFM